MKLLRILSTMAFMAALGSVCSAQTFDVQYEYLGTWRTASTAVSFLCTSTSSGAGSPYSYSIPFQFVCFYPSVDGIDEPVGSGSAIVNLTQFARASVLIIGTSGSGIAHAVCGGKTANASLSAAGFADDPEGPSAIAGLSALGADLIWLYDSVNEQWLGIWPLVSETMSGSSSYTPANGGDFRDYARAITTVAAGAMIITSNTIVVHQ
jgi:hypothetical protein